MICSAWRLISCTITQTQAQGLLYSDCVFRCQGGVIKVRDVLFNTASGESVSLMAIDGVIKGSACFLRKQLLVSLIDMHSATHGYDDLIKYACQLHFLDSHARSSIMMRCIYLRAYFYCRSNFSSSTEAASASPSALPICLRINWRKCLVCEIFLCTAIASDCVSQVHRCRRFC